MKLPKFLTRIVEKFTKPKIITDVSRTRPYLMRWDFRFPFNLGTLKLHQIVRADNDRCHHNHPWWFVRIILWGGYEEVFGEDNRVQVLRPGTISYCPINFRHRITRLLAGPSWSLVITGPRQQDWGFYTKMGFTAWRDFVNALYINRVAWCEDGQAVEVEAPSGR